jgi:hypothetical protein
MTRLYYDFMVYDIAFALPGGMHNHWRLALARRYYTCASIATIMRLVGISQLLDILIKHCGYRTTPNQTVSKESARIFVIFTLPDIIHLLFSDNVYSRHSS